VVQFNVWASAVFGLLSAASWGAGDFCGGMATKRTAVSTVVGGSQMVGAASMLLLALATREPVPPAANLIWCALAGISGAIGLLALYRALAIGRMGVAAPVSGVLSAAVPVVAGSFVDGPPDAIRMAGFGLAFIAVWLVARTDAAAIDPRELGLPVTAGFGFGLFIAVIGRASAGSVFWALVAARAGSLFVLFWVTRMTRQPFVPERRFVPIVAFAGLFDAGGNAFLVMAAQAGRLDVAAVLSSLYPAMTVVLAAWRLRERIGQWQMVGLVASFAAIITITAG
jgi:drug/metabolite transporter (DMT)-like permease